MHDSVFISKQNMWGESNMERSKERESVCERQSVAGNENSVSNKIDNWQK